MLDDRSYMREDSYRRNWSASLVLIVTLTVIYALQCINDIHFRLPIEPYLAMTQDGLRHGFIWQLLTFQFLHGSLWHLAGNALTLWFIGRTVEGYLGTRRFLIAYFLSGVAGGILQGALMLLFPAHFGSMVYGASAGTSGIFAVFAMIAGQSEIRLNFILPIRARVLLYIMGGIALFFTLFPTPRDGVAHAAHLGGLLAGVAFVRWPVPQTMTFSNPFKSRQRKRQLVQAASKAARWRTERAKASPELPSEEFISKEVDPILDKISAHGIHSLTAREREILEAARAKMAKR